MEELYKRLYTVYVLIRGFIHRPPINRNPLEVRLRLIVQEELHTVTSALQILHSDPVDLDELKESLTIIYHADEAAQPTVRAWVRASRWMHSASEPEIEGVDSTFKRIFRDLKKGVRTIEQIYGEVDAKYMVPIEYRRRAGRGA